MTDVILVIPFGGHDTPIAFGTVDYQPSAYRADITDPNSAWLVKMPPHHAEHFTKTGSGFYPMPQETAPRFSGTARLYAPFGCSWAGVQYIPGPDDIVTVPSEAVADLLAFPPICPENARPERVDPAPAENETAELGRQLALKHEALMDLQVEHAALFKEHAALKTKLDATKEPAAEPAKAKVEAKPAAKS